jgi:hypothetical protein
MANITEDINYPKVVWEQLRRWRVVRAPLLTALDVEFLRALETDDVIKKAEVISKKTELRDITNYDFSNVTELGEISAIWPECLGTRPDELKDIPQND